MKKKIFVITTILILLTASSALAKENPFDYFRKHYNDRDPKMRARAVRKLGALKNLQSTKKLVIMLADPHPYVRVTTVKELSHIKDKETIKWLASKALFSRKSLIRLHTAQVLGNIAETSVKKYLVHALKDSNWKVVVEAIYALGKIKCENAILKLANSSTWQIKAAVIETLGKMKSDNVIPLAKKGFSEHKYQIKIASLEAMLLADKIEARKAAIELLDNHKWQVRATAIEILEEIHDKLCIEPLIKRLPKEKGRLRGDIVYALQSLTNKIIWANYNAWKNWWEANKNKFKLPPKPKSKKRKADPHASVAYHGIQIFSKRIIFSIDLSQSMGDKMGTSKETRMEMAEKEFKRTILKYPRDAYFNIVLFATKIEPWRRSLTIASLGNKRTSIFWLNKRAKQWIERRKKGRTNIYDSLTLAFKDKEVDTILLLTDGSATEGVFQNTTDIIRSIKKMNKYRKIKIHTIGICQTKRGKGLLKKLADETRGQNVLKD